MEIFGGLEHVVRTQEPMAPHTGLRVGGTSDFFSEPTSIDELVSLVTRCREPDISVRLLGGGSNVLVRDQGVDGLVIHLSAPEFSEIKTLPAGLVVGGGAKLSHAIATAVREGLGGMEQLVGIPGTIGGALHGNAGTPGGDVGRRTVTARVLTRSGEIHTRTETDLRFAYLQSSLDELAILDATFALEPDDSEELTKRMQTLWIVKKTSLPRGGFNTGCVFRNPPGANATALLEQAGLKGTVIGDAQVSEENANYIISSTASSSSDLLRLIDHMKAQTLERLGVELEVELEIW